MHSEFFARGYYDALEKCGYAGEYGEPEPQGPGIAPMVGLAGGGLGMGYLGRGLGRQYGVGKDPALMADPKIRALEEQQRLHDLLSGRVGQTGLGKYKSRDFKNIAGDLDQYKGTPVTQEMVEKYHKGTVAPGLKYKAKMMKKSPAVKSYGRMGGVGLGLLGAGLGYNLLSGN